MWAVKPWTEGPRGHGTEAIPVPFCATTAPGQAPVGSAQAGTGAQPAAGQAV